MAIIHELTEKDILKQPIHIQNSIREHIKTIKRIEKKFHLTKKQAEWCLDKACDYNIQDEKDLDNIVMIIANTLKSISDEYDLDDIDNEVVTCCVCGTECIPQEDCPEC
jgi:hypothetical protein